MVTQVFSYEFIHILYRLLFTFRFMIHFELIFIYAKRYEFKSIYLHMYIQLFHHYLLKRLFCSTELPLHLCRESVMHHIHFLGEPKKVPETFWLQTTKLNSVTVLEARSLKLRGWQAPLCMEAVGDNPLLSLPGSRGSRHSLAYDSLTSIAAHIHLAFSPGICQRLPLFLQGTCHWI